MIYAHCIWFSCFSLLKLRSYALLMNKCTILFLEQFRLNCVMILCSLVSPSQWQFAFLSIFMKKQERKWQHHGNRFVWESYLFYPCGSWCVLLLCFLVDLECSGRTLSEKYKTIILQVLFLSRRDDILDQTVEKDEASSTSSESDGESDSSSSTSNSSYNDNEADTAEHETRKAEQPRPTRESPSRRKVTMSDVGTDSEEDRRAMEDRWRWRNQINLYWLCGQRRCFTDHCFLDVRLSRNH